MSELAFRRAAGELPRFEWAALRCAGVAAMVTTREGGVSTGGYASLNLGDHVGDDPAAVAENRRRAVAALGRRPEQLAFMSQVHGTQVAVVEQVPPAPPVADVLVTTSPEVVLAVLVADCVPIVLADPLARVLAVAHAGWGGTAKDVAGTAMAAMCAVGASPDRVVAGIGPAADPQTYEVGAEVAGAFEPEVLTPTRPGHWLLDLPEANRRRLVAAGVRPEQIWSAGVSTGPGTPFYSHRHRGEATAAGRFGALAVLP